MDQFRRKRKFGREKQSCLVVTKDNCEKSRKRERNSNRKYNLKCTIGKNHNTAATKIANKKIGFMLIS